MEEIMRVLTLYELMSFTRADLELMFQVISAILPSLAEDTLGLRIAFINLKNIKRELNRRDMVSGRWHR
jgi:hypothetical protein